MKIKVISNQQDNGKGRHMKGINSQPNKKGTCDHLSAQKGIGNFLKTLCLNKFASFARTANRPDMKDWCTAWPDRWAHVDYSECCQVHDEDYARIRSMSFWRGVWARRKADYKLMRCVRKKGLPMMGLVMFIGVRLAGWLFAYRRGS